jgi:beta-glucosidase
LIPKEAGSNSPAWIEANSRHVTTVLEGIRALVSRETRVEHAPGCGNMNPDTSGIAEAVRIAREAEAVVLVLGDRSGLLPDCTCGETRDSAALRLLGAQHELALSILETGRPVAIVLITGRPYAVPDLASRASSILQAWLPGEEGGMAIAEVLFGDFNPGGRLPITFPRSVGQVPVSYDHKPSAMRSNWYVDYVDETVKPLYPFGHGLSYTTFAYENLSIAPEKASPGGTIDIGADIANTGSRRGEEVVQLYTRDEFASLPRPVKELRGYLRLALEPRERKRVIFRLPVDQLAVHDQELCLGIEAGRIQVMLGSSSDDIRLQGEFEIVCQGMVAIPRRVFVCPGHVE